MNGFLLERRSVDALYHDPVAGPVQMVDVVVYDHAGGVLPCRLHAHVRFLLLLDDLRPQDHRHGRRVRQAQAVQPGDTIYETSYAPNHLTYKSHSANGGLAVFSEIYFPWGWKVSVDGKPVEMGRVNYVLRALQLPAGDHEIDFKYDPDEVNKTQSWATIAVVIIYLLLLTALNYAYLRQKAAQNSEE